VDSCRPPLRKITHRIRGRHDRRANRCGGPWEAGTPHASQVTTAVAPGECPAELGSQAEAQHAAELDIRPTVRSWAPSRRLARRCPSVHPARSGVASLAYANRSPRRPTGATSSKDRTALSSSREHSVEKASIRRVRAGPRSTRDGSEKANRDVLSVGQERQREHHQAGPAPHPIGDRLTLGGTSTAQHGASRVQHDILDIGSAADERRACRPRACR
jgi:hypothetical protein